MESVRSEGAIEGLQFSDVESFFHTITRQHARPQDIVERESEGALPAQISDLARQRPLPAPPIQCSPSGKGHASGWCSDRADHRPWSSGRTSSAASEASTSAASPDSSVKSAHDFSRLPSPDEQWLPVDWEEGPATLPAV